ncbi:MAG: hypothetical protein R2912_01435 [Eubacteriales bacterium]
MCLSGKHEDLVKTDRAADGLHRPRALLAGSGQSRLDSGRGTKSSSSSARKARILYQDEEGQVPHRAEVQRYGA